MRVCGGDEITSLSSSSSEGRGNKSLLNLGLNSKAAASTINSSVQREREVVWRWMDGYIHTT